MPHKDFSVSYEKAILNRLLRSRQKDSQFWHNNNNTSYDINTSFVVKFSIDRATSFTGCKKCLFLVETFCYRYEVFCVKNLFKYMLSQMEILKIKHEIIINIFKISSLKTIITWQDNILRRCFSFLKWLHLEIKLPNMFIHAIKC